MRMPGLGRLAGVVSLGMLLALLGFVGPAAAEDSPAGSHADHSGLATLLVADRSHVRAGQLVQPGPGELDSDLPAGGPCSAAEFRHVHSPSSTVAAGAPDWSTRAGRAPPASAS